MDEWRRPRPVDVPAWKDATDRKGPHDCSVANCPAYGVQTEQVRGGLVWYCPWHWEHRHNVEACNRVTSYLLKVGVKEALRRRYGAPPLTRPAS